MNALRTLMLALAATALVAAPALAGTYVGGGTFVVATPLGTVLDNGGVVCQGTNGDGIGGGCLLFPEATREGGFVAVKDQVAGLSVAFQVCIDNNGDGICGGPQGLGGRCFDQIFFSHSDGGVFHNALGPLPTRFLEGCPGGFPGYVVLLCQGEHVERDGSAHSHALTRGSIQLASKGTGYGTFCGGSGEGQPGSLGNNAAVAKAYKVV